MTWSTCFNSLVFARDPVDTYWRFSFQQKTLVVFEQQHIRLSVGRIPPADQNRLSAPRHPQARRIIFASAFHLGSSPRVQAAKIKKRPAGRAFFSRSIISPYMFMQGWRKHSRPDVCRGSCRISTCEPELVFLHIDGDIRYQLLIMVVCERTKGSIASLHAMSIYCFVEKGVFDMCCLDRNKRIC